MSRAGCRGVIGCTAHVAYGVKVCVLVRALLGVDVRIAEEEVINRERCLGLIAEEIKESAVRPFFARSVKAVCAVNLNILRAVNRYENAEVFCLTNGKLIVVSGDTDIVPLTCFKLR